MKNVFLDTVGLLAIWDEADQWHGVASHAWDDFFQRGYGYLTTPDVLNECANAAARKAYRQDVVALRNELRLFGKLIVPSEAEVEHAWAAYEHSEAAAAGIVDQISFQIMRRLGVTKAFTNDKHYIAAGFTVLF